MFLMPCFYCDVSDAWLFREKSKRLWVTTAGSYCDLCTGLGVFLWRLTLPQTMIGAFATLSSRFAARHVFLNMIPFLKLDGYYFASDLFELPNMRRRSLGKVADHALVAMRRGPEAEPRGGTLLAIGLVTGRFPSFPGYHADIDHASLPWSLGYLGLLQHCVSIMVVGPQPFCGFLERRDHEDVPVSPSTLVVLVRGVGHGRRRICVRTDGRKSVGAVSRSAQQPGGDPCAGFGVLANRLSGGRPRRRARNAIVLLEVPDLSSKISEKQAEVNEARAKLTLVEVGPRKEEIDEQRQKAARAKNARSRRTGFGP